ncbi:MAG: hypothetical protein A4E53_02789 [Pelotomaculum sp. PtaB.Bin104]|nr:MAG: hypothetical protein A4E53_02789 [Pelotomaculum sp. PtaB.Bin104]
MLSYRTIAGIGAAALALMAMSKATRHMRNRTDKLQRNSITKAATRVEGIIRKRDASSANIVNDVI